MTATETKQTTAEALQQAQERRKAAEARFTEIDDQRVAQACTVTELATRHGADALDSDPVQVSKRLTEARLKLLELEAAAEAAESALNVAERDEKLARAADLDTRASQAEHVSARHNARLAELRAQIEALEGVPLVNPPQVALNFGKRQPKSKKLENEAISLRMRARAIRRELNRDH